MATINIGRLKPVFQGAYDNAQGYVVDDIVTYSGETYICILASTGNVPTNTTYWSKMASKGADGVDADLFSISGTAQGDLYYNNGSAIARLGAGTSGQFLKTQGTGANPQWGDVVSNLTDTAIFEYQDSIGRFTSIDSATGMGIGDRIVVPYNSLLDPYSIIASSGSNNFQVTTTGAYRADMYCQVHNLNHHKLFIYNSTDNQFAPRPNGSFTGGDNFQAPIVSYNVGQGENSNTADCYWLDSSKVYQMRQSSDNTIGTFNSNTSYLFGNYSIGGITSRNTLMRLTLTKLSGV